MLNFLAAIALITASAPADDFFSAVIRPPAMNISAVRQIACDEWTGSGFLIGDKIMATANHVMDGATGCRDVESGSPLMVYKQDKAHDLVLVTGPKLPTDMPYVKYSCERFHTGETYLAYGITGYMQNRELVRNNALVATKLYNPEGTVWGDGMNVSGSRIFEGFQAPGMSGGPVTDINGYAHGLVTGGSGFDSSHFEFADGMLCKS